MIYLKREKSFEDSFLLIMKFKTGKIQNNDYKFINKSKINLFAIIADTPARASIKHQTI